MNNSHPRKLRPLPKHLELAGESRQYYYDHKADADYPRSVKRGSRVFLDEAESDEYIARPFKNQRGSSRKAAAFRTGGWRP